VLVNTPTHDLNPGPRLFQHRLKLNSVGGCRVLVNTPTHDLNPGPGLFLHRVETELSGRVPSASKHTNS
jgi:hypothetical protein